MTNPTVYIDQRGPQSWRLRVRVNGHTYTETVRGSHNQAQARRAVLQAHYSDGKAPVKQGTIAAFAMEWLEYRRAIGNIKATTAQHYKIMLKPFLKEYGDRPLLRLSVEDCRRFVTDDVKRTGQKTASHRFKILKAMMATAVKEGHMPSNPFARVDGPRAPVTKKDRTLTRQEVVRLMQVSHDHGPAGLAVRLALATGARRGELAALKWRDVGYKDIFICATASIIDGKVEITEPKSVSSVRSIPIPSEIARELEEMRRLDDEFVLGGVRPDSLSRQMTAVMEAAGIEGLTAHDLRHTHATHLIASKIPLPAVAARLGHSKASTTLDIYAHALPDDASQIADAVGQLLDLRSSMITVPQRPRLVNI